MTRKTVLFFTCNAWAVSTSIVSGPSSLSTVAVVGPPRV